MKPKLLRLHPQDNIVVATAPIKAESVLKLDRVKIQIISNVPMAGKVATRPIAEGEKILKFGQPIGHATRNIEPGEWVHTHNLASDYLPTPKPHPAPPGAKNAQTMADQSADGPTLPDSQASEGSDTQFVGAADALSESAFSRTMPEINQPVSQDSHPSSVMPNEGTTPTRHQSEQVTDGGELPHGPTPDR